MCAKIEEAVGIIRNQSPRRQFRTTWVPGINNLEEIDEMARVLGAGESLLLTGFRSGNTLDPRWRQLRSPTQSELHEVCQRFEDLGIHATLF
ncbi:MAG: hypothetical protein HKM05_02000 [Spirochaetales bacterium]|nr:hypothetical protein [Spirochaetales bacterium]